VGNGVNRNFTESVGEDAALDWLEDKQEKATQTVLEQAEVLSHAWAPA
jgi:hypothetical protein